MKLANTAALAEQPNPAHASDQRPPIDYVEPGAPVVITNPILSPIVRTGGSEPTPQPFRSSGTETRPARRAVAFFHDKWQGWRLHSGDVANGLHAVIARQASGFPVGQQAAWPKARPSTLFRQPDPWDAGTTRATPGSTSA